jgi:flagellar hook-basal body complex protein FliE
MTNSISNLSTINTTSLQGLSSSNKPDGAEGSFKDVMLKSIDEVNTLQQDANRAVEQLATGGDTTPAEVLTAVQKADMAFRMMLQVRNKLVQAYQEVQNIRV